MKIGLFHGYNLTGSGSNEFTRYLAKTFISQGHSVHVICREYQPEKIDFIGELYCWKVDGGYDVTVVDETLKDSCSVHQIPYGDFYPVYITGKKSSTVFKEFVDLSDVELKQFKALNQLLLRKIFSEAEIDILHCNHLVMQPSLAIDPCKEFDIPFIVYPHGSAIEYAVKRDSRYMEEARSAIEACKGLIIGNHEVRDRICALFPDLEELILGKTQIVGVGVDTNLFSPILKDERSKAISTFINTQIPDSNEGKSPELVGKLHNSLEDKEYKAIAINSDSYVQNSLDTDVQAKLTNLDLSQPILIFVGALTVGKGLQSLITALPSIFQRHPGTQLLVIGAGDFREPLESLIYALAHRDNDVIQYLSHKDGEISELWEDVIYYLDRLETEDSYYSNARKLLNQVNFLGRFNHQQLSHIFPCAELAIFPSVIPEAYPLVLMESLANGVLPLVSYFSGFKDGVDELESFLDKDLVSYLRIPMDKESRIRQISENVGYLLDLVKKKDFSNELSGIARNNYDWSHRARQMISAYQQIL